MSNLTIQKRLTLGFAILTSLTLSIGAIGLISTNAINIETKHLIEKEMPGTVLMLQIKNNITWGYAYVERHIRTPDADGMADIANRYDILYKANQELYKQYTTMISDAEDKALFDKLNASAARYGDIRIKLFDISTNKSKAEAIDYINTTLLPEYRTYRAILDEYVDFNIKRSKDRGESVAMSASGANYSITVALIAALAIAFTACTIITRKITAALKKAISTIDEGAAQVAAASSQVASASNMLAEGASEQAASLEETSSSLEEMSSMTAGNAQSAAQAKELADQMRSAADQSADQMRQMQLAMDAIKTSSAGISQIIKTIDEIAFQTNILALNAAVEAARAGEAGAGFAIVAEEVRNLAQRSANSAKETSVKIEGAVKSSEQGVQLSAKVAGSLDTIVVKAREMNHLVSEIASATQEQDRGISQLTLAVSEMDKVTQSNASNAEETASASEELNAHADTLAETVGDLVALVEKSQRRSRQAMLGEGRQLIGLGEPIMQERRPLAANRPEKATLPARQKQRTLAFNSTSKNGFKH